MSQREAKRSLRERVRAQRAGRPAEELERLARALAVVVTELPVVRTATCVAAYASMPGEPGTHILRAALTRHGIEVLLPVVRPDMTLDWAHDSGALQPGRGRGGPEPSGPRLGEEALARADVVLVPALAVDGLGRRLGQGAGCYDRALAHARRGAGVIALVFDEEVLDEVPAEPHDRRVDAAVTPTRWIRLGRAVPA